MLFTSSRLIPAEGSTPLESAETFCSLSVLFAVQQPNDQRAQAAGGHEDSSRMAGL